MTMRRFLPILLLLMPLAAAGQVVGNDKADEATAERLLSQAPDQMTEVQPGVLMPIWRTQDGRMLALKATSDQGGQTPISFRPVDATTALSTGLQYDLGPHLQAHAGVSGESWVNNTAACPHGTNSVASRSARSAAAPSSMRAAVSVSMRKVGSTWAPASAGSVCCQAICSGSARWIRRR
jgi:hypothetical protein